MLTKKPRGLTPWAWVNTIQEPRLLRVAPFPEFLPQDTVEDLSSGGHGHFRILDDIHRLRNLIPSNLSPAMVDQFFFRCRLSFMERNDRLHRLPPLLMRNPNHRHIFHRRMGSDYILHLGWEDILTAG